MNIQRLDSTKLRHLLFALVIPFFLQLSFVGHAGAEEEEINDNPLTATLTVVPEKLSQGAQSKIVIDVELPEGYRAYLDKFKLKWKGLGDVKVGKLDIGPYETFEDSFSGKLKKGVVGKGTIETLIELPVDMPVGETKSKFQLTYQACTEKHCLFPKKIPLESKLIVINMDGTGKDTSVIASVDGANKPKSGGGFWATIGGAISGELSFADAVAQGMVFSFLFIFLAGVLTSFTPCVYPMVPITLAVIGARSKDQSKAKSLMLSLVYVFGIALTFSSLGVVAALTGSLFGSALSSPIVVGVLATIFVILGLSMYGLFELQAPASIRNKLGSQKEAGWGGAFFAGLVSGIVAGPCVGPVLIGVLAHVGEKQDAIYGFSLLFTYSVGMGLLFIAIGTSSSLLNKLPRAGGWMDGVKFFFGTIMVAMALYYVEPLASDQLFHALLAIALILIASSYGAFSTNEGLTGFGRARKGVMLTSFVVGVMFMISAVFGGNPLTMGAAPQGQVAQKVDKLPWKPYSDDLVEQAAANGKPVIIDFYADWCVACKELDMITFTDPLVKELAKDFELLKFDATSDSPELKRLKKKYGVLGLPTIIFKDASGEIMHKQTLTGFEDGNAFSKRMKETL